MNRICDMKVLDHFIESFTRNRCTATDLGKAAKFTKLSNLQRNVYPENILMEVTLSLIFFYFYSYTKLFVNLFKPPVAELLWQVAIVVKISQLPFFVLSSFLLLIQTVHTGEPVIDFYCNFDHPQQYNTMLLTV